MAADPGPLDFTRWRKKHREIRKARAEYQTCLGILYAAEERWDQAERCFRDALCRDPEQGDAYAGLGELEIARGDLGQAREWLEQAHRFAPNRPDVLTNLALVLRDLGERESAETILPTSVL